MSNEEFHQLRDANSKHGVYARALGLRAFEGERVHLHQGWAISDGNVNDGRGATYTGRTWGAAYASWCKARAEEMN